MNPDQLEHLKIDARSKKRPSGSLWLIFSVVFVITALAIYFAWPRKAERRVVKGTGVSAGNPAGSGAGETNSASVEGGGSRVAGSVLTVSGYIVNRERIELSPRFMGVVKWIGVKKGDAVTNQQVVVLLDDTEYRARLREVEGRLAHGRVGMERARLDHERVMSLSKDRVESKQAEDNARLAVEAAKALVEEIEGQAALIKTYLDWTVIRSPINGVVLEKLVDPNELVTPQSFGGTRGPSTALIAVADPNDLQVEIELGESDLSKVSLNQRCKVSPEAYPEKSYEGVVAEMAPEASRQKGTLQLKVQIKNPDRYLTPELSARVDFLGPEKSAPGR